MGIFDRFKPGNGKGKSSSEETPLITRVNSSTVVSRENPFLLETIYDGCEPGDTVAFIEGDKLQGADYKTIERQLDSAVNDIRKNGYSAHFSDTHDNQDSPIYSMASLLDRGLKILFAPNVEEYLAMVQASCKKDVIKDPTQRTDKTVIPRLENVEGKHDRVTFDLLRTDLFGECDFLNFGLAHSSLDRKPVFRIYELTEKGVRYNGFSNDTPKGVISGYLVAASVMNTEEKDCTVDMQTDFFNILYHFIRKDLVANYIYWKVDPDAEGMRDERDLTGLKLDKNHIETLNELALRATKDLISIDNDKNKVDPCTAIKIISTVSSIAGLLECDYSDGRRVKLNQTIYDIGDNMNIYIRDIHNIRRGIAYSVRNELNSDGSPDDHGDLFDANANPIKFMKEYDEAHKSENEVFHVEELGTDIPENWDKREKLIVARRNKKRNGD